MLRLERWACHSVVRVSYERNGLMNEVVLELLSFVREMCDCEKVT